MSLNKCSLASISIPTVNLSPLVSYKLVGYAQYADPQLCRLELPRGKRVKVCNCFMYSVAQWRRLIWTDPLPNSTMAAGSRKTYALDLNDISAFPDRNNIPLRPPDTKNGESWVILLEVGLLFAVSNAVLCCKL
jgi:hypothetical protein